MWLEGDPWPWPWIFYVILGTNWKPEHIALVSWSDSQELLADAAFELRRRGGERK